MDNIYTHKLICVSICCPDQDMYRKIQINYSFTNLSTLGNVDENIGLRTRRVRVEGNRKRDTLTNVDAYDRT